MIEAETNAAVKMLEAIEKTAMVEGTSFTNAIAWIIVLGMHSNTSSIDLPKTISIPRAKNACLACFFCVTQR